MFPGDFLGRIGLVTAEGSTMDGGGVIDREFRGPTPRRAGGRAAGYSVLIVIAVLAVAQLAALAAVGRPAWQGLSLAAVSP